MKPQENGYPGTMQTRPATNGPTAWEALRNAAAVVGVVAVVLGLLVLGVYAVVYLDVMPHMR